MDTLTTFFPARPEVRPSIYAYRDKNPDHADFLKVGYTEIDVERRVAQQFPVIQPGERQTVRDRLRRERHAHGRLLLYGPRGP